MDVGATLIIGFVDEGGLVSLWQSNSVALRAERRFAFSKFRSDCVAVLAGLSL